MNDGRDKETVTDEEEFESDENKSSREEGLISHIGIHSKITRRNSR